MGRKFKNFDEFYAFYLKEHSEPMTRLIHCGGTLVGLAIVFGGVFFFKNWWSLLYGPLFAYTVLFLSHFFIEKNMPATLNNPFYSFMADWRMLYDTLCGKISLDKKL